MQLNNLLPPPPVFGLLYETTDNCRRFFGGAIFTGDEDAPIVFNINRAYPSPFFYFINRLAPASDNHSNLLFFHLYNQNLRRNGRNICAPRALFQTLLQVLQSAHLLLSHPSAPQLRPRACPQL